MVMVMTVVVLEETGLVTDLSSKVQQPSAPLAAAGGSYLSELVRG